MNSAGGAAKKFRDIKYDTISEIAKLIDENKAKAVFILGDLFDSDRVGEPDILKIENILSKFNCPVYIMPGNHDWWHQGGTIQTFKRLAEKEKNIHLILENTPISIETIPNATFFPSPIKRKNPINDISECIPKRDEKHGLRIGLLHGSINTAPNGTIPSNVTKIRDLDITFLGDWHNPVEIDEKTYYCGSLEPGGFDEGHKGQVLVVEVDKSKINVKPVIVGKIAWKRIELKMESKEIGGLGINSLTKALESIKTPPEATAIRLHLSGSLSWDEQNELDQVLTKLQMDDWAYIDLEDIQINSLGEVNIDSFPDAVQAVAENILESNEDKIVKRRALAILKSKLEEEA